MQRGHKDTGLEEGHCPQDAVTAVSPGLPHVSVCDVRTPWGWVTPSAISGLEHS